MTVTLYGFKNKQTAQRLKADSDNPRRRRAGIQHPQEQLDGKWQPFYGSQYLVLTPAGGIPKRVGNVLGKASCQIEWVDNADMAAGLPNVKGNLVSVEVWNNSLEDIPGDTVVIANDIYGKPVIDAPVAAQPPDVQPRPWMKFTTTGKMTSEQIAAVIDLVEPGNLINPGTSLPWAPGDVVNVADPHNQWALAEADATGTAYYRTAGNRWEIQTCSLPAEYLEGNLYVGGGGLGHLVPGDIIPIDVDISGGTDFPWSYPGVDPPPAAEINGTLIRCTNPYQFAAKAGSLVIIRRTSTNQAFSDANDLALGPGNSSTAQEWQIIRVKEPIAKYIRATVPSGLQDTLEAIGDPTIYWDGEGPTTVRAHRSFDIPCDAEFICSFDPDDSKNDDLIYRTVSAPSSHLPAPSEEDILVNGLTSSGTCGIDYSLRKAFVWNTPEQSSGNCIEQITGGTVSLATTTIEVASNIRYDASGLHWDCLSIDVCASTACTGGTLPFAVCPPPDDPCGYTEYRWNAGTRQWDFFADHCTSPCTEDLANKPAIPADPADDPPDGWPGYGICTDFT